MDYTSIFDDFLPPRKLRDPSRRIIFTSLSGAFGESRSRVAIKKEATVSTLHILRLVASYALLGAVLAGASLGWFHNLPFDPRSIGVAVGVIAGLVVVIRHRFDEASPQRA